MLNEVAVKGVESQRENAKNIPITAIVRNSFQPRGEKSIIPVLYDAGWTVFSQDPVKAGVEPKGSLAVALMSGDAAAMTGAMDLIRKDAADIAEFASQLRQAGQIQNVSLMPMGNGTYDLISGARRTLALAFAWAETNGEGSPSTVFATISEGDINNEEDRQKAFWDAAGENFQRLNQDPLSLGELFSKLAKMFPAGNGKVQTDKDIAVRLYNDESKYQTVRNYRQLTKLPAEEKEKLRSGTMGLTAGLKLLDKIKKAKAGEKPTGEAKKTTKDRVPTVAQTKALLKCTTGVAAREVVDYFTPKHWELWSNEGCRKAMAFMTGTPYLDLAATEAANLKEAAEAEAAKAKIEKEKADALAAKEAAKAAKLAAKAKTASTEEESDDA